MKQFTIAITFFISTISFGQSKVFEPNLITNNDTFGVTVSPDGEMLLYTKAYNGRDTLRIFQSQKINGQWQKPELAFFADIKFKQIDPTFSPDGKTILYNTLESAENSFDVFAVHKTKTGWTKPEKLTNAINTKSSDFYATISLNKNIYFTRRTKSNDIYVSYFIDNKYQNAKLLEGTINSDMNESNPYISPKEDYIIFFSDKTGGLGDTDLYISFNKNNKWSHPINLGNKVNSEIGEFCPSVDAKNKQFLFSRTKVVDGKRIENTYGIPLIDLNLKAMEKLAKWEK
jgi:Tol biopolymer transport system component